jgi:hypothetical protein
VTDQAQIVNEFPFRQQSPTGQQLVILENDVDLGAGRLNSSQLIEKLFFSYFGANRTQLADESEIAAIVVAGLDWSDVHYKV